MTQSPTSEDTVDRRAILFAAVWRWHGIAGLLVAPLLMISAITGGIYLFPQEVDALQFPDYYAPPTPGAAPLSQQVAAATQLVPGLIPVKITVAPELNRPTEIQWMDEDGQTTTVVVDPGSGEARGKFLESTRLTANAFQIHTDLFAGYWGGVLLECGACWGLVLMITGLYLWWPRGNRRWFSALRPRLSTPGAPRWRELHAVLSVWLAIPAAMLLLTGLPWTAVWGDFFNHTATAAGSGFPNEVFWWRPKSTAAADAPRLTLDEIAQAVKGREFPRVLEFHWPRSAEDTWLVRGAMGYDPALSRYSFVDPRSGVILDERDWQDIGLMQRPVSYGVALHMGLLFGNPNRLLSLWGVIGVLVMTLTAPILWWKRRQGRTTLFPPPADLRLLPRWSWVLIAVLALLLPVAGVTFLAALCLGWLRRRVWP